MNPQSPPADARQAERLSALVDGEALPDEVSGLMSDWRSEPALRKRWHDYQLIGDVLRSDDLAAAPGHDAAFLQRLRERLAQEPAVLAPAPRPQPLSRRPRPGRWAASAAVAAACVMVIGALVVTRGPGEDAAAPQLASAPPAESRPVLVGPDLPQALATSAVTGAETGGLLRDAGLDHYLAAHKQFADRIGSGEPSPFLRSAAHADAER